MVSGDRFLFYALTIWFPLGGRQQGVCCSPYPLPFYLSAVLRNSDVSWPWNNCPFATESWNSTLLRSLGGLNNSVENSLMSHPEPQITHFNFQLSVKSSCYLAYQLWAQITPNKNREKFCAPLKQRLMPGSRNMTAKAVLTCIVSPPAGRKVLQLTGEGFLVLGGFFYTASSY